jgi:hypothetical protein
MPDVFPILLIEQQILHFISVAGSAGESAASPSHVRTSGIDDTLNSDGNGIQKIKHFPLNL